MKLFLTALAISTLSSFSIFGVSCGSTSVQEQETAKLAVKSESSPTPAAETVTLTNQNPTGSFLLPGVLFKKPPPILEVSVTKVVNPASEPVTIFVYLSPRNPKDDAAERIAVGNFSLHPADKPAKFMLDTGSLQGVSERSNVPAAEAWQLVFELEKQGQQRSSPLEVTIASPNWKSDKN
jgi:hypothetical protein